MSNLATITNNILADSGIDDINVVVSTGSYADPAWITSLAWTKITGAPANIVTGTGSVGQVAFFNGTSSITGESNLFWDATNDRLGIGTAIPASKLQVDGTGYSLIAGSDAGNRRIYIGLESTGEPSIQGALSNGTVRQISINPSGGNVLINTTTPNGNTLRVGGTGWFDSGVFATEGVFNNGTGSGNGIKVISSLSSSLFTGGIEFLRTTVAGGSKVQPLRDAAIGGVGFDFLVTANNTAEINATYTSALRILNTGAATFSNLAGSGTRMVVADANGLLSTQAIGSGSITGTGTTNYLPKFTGASTIGNSNIQDNGTTVTVGGPSVFSNTVTAGSGTDGNGYLLKATDGSIFRVIDPTPAGGLSSVNIGSIGTASGDVRIHASNVLFLGNDGNNERMRILPDGNVIIQSGGTFINNGAKLQVSGSARINGSSRIGNAATASISTSSTGLDVIIGSGTSSSPAFQVWDDNSLSLPRFIVSRIGNVGINTTTFGGRLSISESATTALRIDSGVGVAAISVGGSGIISVDAPGIGGQRFTLLDNGNAGFGTAAPSGASGRTLVVNGTTGQARFALKTDSTGDAAGDGFQFVVSGIDASIEQRENASLDFATNAQGRVRITNIGNVGIGTITPTAIGNYRSLTLDGSDGSIIDLRFAGSANGRIFSSNDTAVGIESLSTTLPLIFKTQNGSGSLERMRITPSGDVGIGNWSTNVPQDRLHVNGAIQVGFVNSLNSALRIFWNGASSYGAIQTSSSSALALNPGGNNVLIGTTTDNGQRLQVNGDFYAEKQSGNASLFFKRIVNDTKFEISVQESRTRIRTWQTANDRDLYFDSDQAGTTRMIIAGGGAVTINNLAGSGNRIVVANSNGTLISAVIGSGLAFDGTTLTATGGSSGSISGSGSSGTIALFTGTSSIGNSIITQSSSNVGIGTGTPNYKLNVFDTGVVISGGQANWSTNTRGIMIDNTNNGDEAVGVWFRTGTNHLSGISGQRRDNTVGWGTDLRFYTHPDETSNLSSAFERMRITSEGNVGIGNTNPGSKLGIQVANSGSNVSALDITNAVNASFNVSLRTDFTTITAGGTGNMVFANAAERLRITSNGTISINGSSDIGDAGLAKMSLGYFNGNYGWLQTWSGTRLLLNPFGNNVLIGTSTDNGNRLRVNGTIFSDSSVTATSFFESSDATIKTLVQDNYQAKGIESVVAKLYIKNGKQELGYFAQDLQDILPSAVNKGTDGLLNLSYREVHTAKIAALEKEIAELKKQLKNN